MSPVRDPPPPSIPYLLPSLDLAFHPIWNKPWIPIGLSLIQPLRDQQLTLCRIIPSHLAIRSLPLPPSLTTRHPSARLEPKDVSCFFQRMNASVRDHTGYWKKHFDHSSIRDGINEAEYTTVKDRQVEFEFNRVEHDF